MGKCANILIAPIAGIAALRPGHCAMIRIIVKMVTA